MIIKSIFLDIKETSKNATIFNSILGISWFFFLGNSLFFTLPVYVKSYIGGGLQVVTLFLVCLATGLGLGKVLYKKLSFGRVELGLVPIGSFLMTIFLLDLFFASQQWLLGHPLDTWTSKSLMTVFDYIDKPGSLRILVDLFGLSIFGSVFILPLYTLLQTRLPKESRSCVTAANLFLNGISITLSASLLMVFYAANLTVVHIFLILALMNLVISTYIYLLVPEFVLRFGSWILLHVMYRVHCEGLEKIPKNGPAVLICNHVSYVDWLVISGFIDRPIRFLIHYEIARIPGLHFFFQHAKAIPITSQKKNPKIFRQAMEKIRDELAAGELVCIFPEGKITLDGNLSTFRSGVEQIVETTPVMVYPLVLRGLWGSFFSYKDGKAFRKIPSRVRHPIELIISDGVPPDKISAPRLQELVQALVD